MSPAPRPEAPRFLRSALVISPRWGSDPSIISLGELLSTSGIMVEAGKSIDEAIELLSGKAQASECTIVDATGILQAGSGGLDSLVAGLRRLRESKPLVASVVVAEKPTAVLVTTAFRAGATDVVELGGGDDVSILAALDRAAGEYAGRVAKSDRLTELRQVVDDFLRVLVRTERRNLELESALTPADEAEAGPPRVLIVDDEAAVADLLIDVLTRLGLRTITAYSGEEAIEEVERAHRRREAIDLALVDKNLPGIDGLQAIADFRRQIPGLPCILMTGFSSNDSALRAADMGVVGYVLKPFDDVQELAVRVKELAERYATERRERRLLARIKQKHAQFLERYQRILADLDRLGE